jgi:hypothetical protein
LRVQLLRERGFGSELPARRGKKQIRAALGREPEQMLNELLEEIGFTSMDELEEFVHKAKV